MKKSELYKIIREEIEVVLTNEEAEEMFDLDMSALLNEIMDEGEESDEEKQARIRDLGDRRVASWQKQRAAATAAEEERIAAGGAPRPLRGIAKRRAEKIAAAKAARGENLEEKKLSSKERKDMSSSSFIFPDGKHFPIPDESHGRNALARANQFSSPPKWYKGSLQSFVSRVHSAVKKKFPGIDTTEKSEKPGKG